MYRYSGALKVYVRKKIRPPHCQIIPKKPLVNEGCSIEQFLG